MDILDIDNSSQNKRQGIGSTDQTDNISLVENGNKIKHDLPPEEVAKSIWAQWLTIRKLVNAQYVEQSHKQNKND